MIIRVRHIISDVCVLHPVSIVLVIAPLETIDACLAGGGFHPVIELLNDSQVQKVNADDDAGMIV